MTVSQIEVKELFEDLAAVAGSVRTAAEDLSFERLLRVAKRAAVGNTRERQLLIKAIARFEAVRQPIPTDPELAK